jgi:hypothetical protein
VISDACLPVGLALDSALEEAPASTVSRAVDVVAVPANGGWNGVVYGGQSVRHNGGKLPPWYADLLSTSKASRYPYIHKKFGINVAYHGDAHRAAGWEFFMRGDVCGPNVGVLQGGWHSLAL